MTHQTPCHARVRMALDWYAGHQGNWQPVVRELDAFFQRDPERAIAVLETWPEPCHYPAMLYLRQDCGVESHEVDTADGTSRNIVVCFPGEEHERVITPLHKRDLPAEELFLAKLIAGDFDGLPSSVTGVPKRPGFLS